MNSQPNENGLSPAHKLFNGPTHTYIHIPSLKPQPKFSTTETAIDPETQNQLLTLKPGDTIKRRTNKEKAWDKKGSVISSNI